MKKVRIKNYLINEGVLGTVKDNWGKGLIAAGGTGAIAHSGALGNGPKEVVDAFGNSVSKAVGNIGKYFDNGANAMKNTYNHPSSPVSDHPHQQPDGDADGENFDLNRYIKTTKEYLDNFNLHDHFNNARSAFDAAKNNISGAADTATGAIKSVFDNASKYITN